MSEQALNLRRSVHKVRRHRILIGSAIALGLVLGSAYSVQHPPMVTSTRREKIFTYGQDVDIGHA